MHGKKQFNYIVHVENLINGKQRVQEHHSCLKLMHGDSKIWRFQPQNIALLFALISLQFRHSLRSFQTI